LDDNTYSKFLKDFNNIRFNNSEFDSFRVFKSNKSNLYSFDNLLSNNVYFYDNTLPVSIFSYSNDIEYITEGFIPFEENDEYFNEYFKVLLNKLINNQEHYRKNNRCVEFVCTLLSYLYDNSDNHYFKTSIKDKISILKNGLDEYLPFSRLFLDRPKDSIILNHF
jgi:hypothetical protein